MAGALLVAAAAGARGVAEAGVRETEPRPASTGRSDEADTEDRHAVAGARARPGGAEAISAAVALAGRLWPDSTVEEMLFPALRGAPPAHGSWTRCPAARGDAAEAPSWLREASVTPGCTAALREAAGAGSAPAQDLLSAAAYCDDPAAVRRALERGADPDGSDSCGWTALVAASSVGAAAAMDALLEAGAAPGLASGPAAWTRPPLVAALAHGRVDAASRLLRAAADPNATTHGGRSALMLAVTTGNVDLVRRLLKAGARPCQRDDLGLAPLALARARDLPEMAKVLVPATARCDADLAWRYGKVAVTGWRRKEQRWKKARR